MIWMILLPVIGVAWFFVGYYNRWKNGSNYNGEEYQKLYPTFSQYLTSNEWVIPVSGCVLFIIMGCVIIGAISGSIVGGSIEREYDVVSTRNIRALSRDSSISGSFFLGCGRIDNINYLFFYLEGENGELIYKEMAQDECRIFEEDTDKATFVIKHSRAKNPAAGLWAIVGHDYYEFHIPKGSIAYDLDFMGKKK